MNRVLLVVLLMVLMKWAGAQDYLTSGASPDLHLTHTVSAKETWYAIARTYNLAPKEIAAYNKMRIDQPLEIGQTLKIPLTSANFTQNEKKSSDEVLLPVYHVVQEKEWMYRISVNHNKVPIETLEKWNSITRDDARAGMKLIVGHLKVKQGNGALASTGGSAQRTQAPATAQQPVTPPQASRPDTGRPSNTTATTQSNSGQSGTALGGGGYFRSQFGGSGKNSSGVAGIFKSTSGWKDGKYYALMNNVTVGTIVRISLPQTNKTVYAKVLGELPDMKESAGLALRISDAAASELGAVSSKFSVEVSY